MKKQISFSATGSEESIGNFKIRRMIPNRYADAVGSFVFLDYLVSQHRTSNGAKGVGSHPHRGIATLTYLLSGKAYHYDSMGNKGVISGGGVQWMKAGKGIMHDEVMVSDDESEFTDIHGFQFWINLPPGQKKEDPEYLSVDGNDMPFISPGEGVLLKVIIGKYENMISPVPIYKDMFLYHIKLTSGSKFELDVVENAESALFVIAGPAEVNNQTFQNGEFVEMDRKSGMIIIENTGTHPNEVLLFGGEPYTDPIVADGPFVMNSRDEIRMAYRDFMGGKYGKVEY